MAGIGVGRHRIPGLIDPKTVTIVPTAFIPATSGSYSFSGVSPLSATLETSGASDKNVVLTWTDNNTDTGTTINEAGFEIQRSGSTGWSSIAMCPAGTTSFIDTTGVESTTYQYRIAPFFKVSGNLETTNAVTTDTPVYTSSFSMAFDSTNDVMHMTGTNFKAAMQALTSSAGFTVNWWHKRPIVDSDGQVFAWYTTYDAGGNIASNVGYLAIETGDEGSTSEYRFHMSTGVGTALQQRGILTNGTGVTANAWVHIAWVYYPGGADNASRLKVYTNGVERAMSSFPNTVPTSWTPALVGTDVGWIGGGTWGGPMSQSIDEFMVWNSALSPQQVSDVWNSGSADLDPRTLSYASGCILWWSMGDQHPGSGSNYSYPYIVDNIRGVTASMTNMGTAAPSGRSTDTP